MAISYDHTIQTTLEKENIGLIIGKNGSNLNKYIHDRAKKEYCDAMNQGNPNEIELRVYFEIQVISKDEKDIGWLIFCRNLQT